MGDALDFLLQVQVLTFPTTKNRGNELIPAGLLRQSVRGLDGFKYT
jgi:hypothetical protein